MIGPGYYQTCGRMLNESGARSSGTSLDIVTFIIGFLIVSGLMFFGWFMLDKCLSSSIQHKQIEVIDTNNLQYNNTHYNYHYGR